VSSEAKPVAIVTGGSGGIGRACGAELVHRGYDVVLSARHADALETAAKELGCRWVAADAAHEEDVARLFAQAGPPKVLVHAAGTLDGTAVREQSAETFTQLFEVNLLSAYHVTRASLRTMGAGDRLIYVSSIAGQRGSRGRSAYSASKAGLGMLAQSVAAEAEPDGIAVHLVTPGPVRTAMIGPGQGKRQWPLEPEDVATVVGWLDALHPRVVLPEIVLRSVASGPFAPQPYEA
jgi:NAD(P)-dependent dehydrogenase (short-subunit alcohol dehydrogenase family)